MTKKHPYPPGDFGIWLIVYMELFTFMWLFIGYAFTRRANLEMFNSSQLLLDQRAGCIKTLKKGYTISNNLYQRYPDCRLFYGFKRGHFNL